MKNSNIIIQPMTRLKSQNSCYKLSLLNFTLKKNSLGHCDIYCHSGIHCWDMAAGAVLVSEAGGVVLDPNGKDFDIMSRRILVASTPKLAEDWSTKIDFKCHEYERDFPEVYNSF